MGTRGACQKQAEAIGGPIAQAFGWRGVAARLPEIEIAAAIEARKEAALGFAGVPIVTLPAPPVHVISEIPKGTLACPSDPATNHVDCYDKANVKIWSNYEHGPWAGQEAPADAPFNAGIGA